MAALPPLAADVPHAAAFTTVPLAALTPALDLQGEAAALGADDETAIALPGGHDEEFAASFRITTVQVSELLKETRAKLDAHQRDLRKARQDLASLTASEKHLASERARDVIRPIRLTAATLQTIQTRAVDLHGKLAEAVTEPGSDAATTSASSLELPQLPESEDAMTTPQETAYRLAAGAFLRAADVLADSASEVLASLDISAAAERQAITEVLAEHDIADPASLQQAEIDAATRWQVADRDARHAVRCPVHGTGDLCVEHAPVRQLQPVTLMVTGACPAASVGFRLPHVRAAECVMVSAGTRHLALALSARGDGCG